MKVCLRCNRLFSTRQQHKRICKRCSRINASILNGVMPTHSIPGIR